MHLSRNIKHDIHIVIYIVKMNLYNQRINDIKTNFSIMSLGIKLCLDGKNVVNIFEVRETTGFQKYTYRIVISIKQYILQK